MSNEWIYMEVPGDPIGKGRPRGTSAGGHVRMYTPKKTADWERSAAMVMSSFWRKAPLDEPVEVQIVALAHRPKRLLRKKDPDHVIWKTTKPDSDNIVKCVLDSLVMAGVLRDDSLVVHHSVMDLYIERDCGPRVCIRLRGAGLEPVEGWWQRKGKTLVEVFEENEHKFVDDLPW
jgi:Holliday junction resolvase RusA-like endonuclease